MVEESVVTPEASRTMVSLRGYLRGYRENSDPENSGVSVSYPGEQLWEDHSVSQCDIHGHNQERWTGRARGGGSGELG